MGRSDKFFAQQSAGLTAEQRLGLRRALMYQMGVYSPKEWAERPGLLVGAVGSGLRTQADIRRWLDRQPPAERAYLMNWVSTDRGKEAEYRKGHMKPKHHQQLEQARARAQEFLAAKDLEGLVMYVDSLPSWLSIELETDQTINGILNNEDRANRFLTGSAEGGPAVPAPAPEPVPRPTLPMPPRPVVIGGPMGAFEAQMGTARCLRKFDAMGALARVGDMEHGDATWLGVTVDACDAGETYFVTGNICDLLTAAAPTLPDNWVLDAPRLPAAVGFVQFEHPLPLPYKEYPWLGPEISSPSWLNGISWSVLGRAATRGGPRVPVPLEHAVSLGFAAYSDTIGADGKPMRLWEGSVGAFYSTLAWDFRTNIDQSLDDYMTGTWRAREKIGLEDDPSMAFAATITRYVAAFFSFALDKRIVSANRTDVQRAFRRRAEAQAAHHRVSPPAPFVKIVELRRLKVIATPKGAEAEPVDWQYRWLVTGHWRQQWHPSLKMHQPKWISPYVKGPDDKPLKIPKATLFAVDR